MIKELPDKSVWLEADAWPERTEFAAELVGQVSSGRYLHWRTANLLEVTVANGRAIYRVDLHGRTYRGQLVYSEGPGFEA